MRESNTPCENRKAKDAGYPQIFGFFVLYGITYKLIKYCNEQQTGCLGIPDKGGTNEKRTYR